MEAIKFKAEKVIETYGFSYNGMSGTIYNNYKRYGRAARKDLVSTIVVCNSELSDEFLKIIFKEIFKEKPFSQVFHQFDYNGKVMLSDITLYYHSLIAGGNNE